ncbi:MAG: tRNA pseudouridine(38-40) synthase TruA [Chlorobium phaeobacteroides]|nr:tRNA pseudouridine(38-40) synthase TruA [Chlorobium phaeobacteroides]MBL6956433.1 tRNA pseudouridine(38-40) synthase TruA [Chlorobium phaeobacteroides]
MTIEYDGTDFSGWQKQPEGVVTVQGVLETTLSRIVQEEVVMTAAGRTDRGVHARGQVANFRTASSLSTGRLLHSLNALLPSTVYVRDMQEVSDLFHARYSALVREYRYFILEQPSAVYRRYAGVYGGTLDVETLNLRASELVGRHDYSVYSKEDAQNGSTFCTVFGASWGRQDEKVVFRIAANRFLRTMVRLLVSAQLEADPGELSVSLRNGRALKNIVPTDPAGLFLWKVLY